MSTEVGETGIEKVRKKCMTQGFSRMKCFSTIFRQFDKDHNKELTLHEFQKGLKAYEVDMDDYEIENLFNLLDKDRSGQIDFQEFYYKLSPPLEGRRLEAIDTVFTLLDKNSDGVLQAEDIIDLFEDRVKHHPKYQSREWNEIDVVENLLTAFKQPDSRDGVVTLQEFRDYYSTVSASVQDDAYFERHLKVCWGV